MKKSTKKTKAAKWSRHPVMPRKDREKIVSDLQSGVYKNMTIPEIEKHLGVSHPWMMALFTGMRSLDMKPVFKIRKRGKPSPNKEKIEQLKLMLKSGKLNNLTYQEIADRFGMQVNHVRVIAYWVKQSGVNLEIRTTRCGQKAFNYPGSKFYDGVVKLAKMDAETLASMHLSDISNTCGTLIVTSTRIRQVIQVLKHAGLLKTN